MSSRSSRSRTNGKRRRVVDAEGLDGEQASTAPAVIDLIDSSPVKGEPDEPQLPLSKGKGKERAHSSPLKPEDEDESKSKPEPLKPQTPPELLSGHTCPICFGTVTNACLTPCGHVLCGSCLFASVKSGIQRALDMHVPMGGEGTSAR
ncbi:hypothetical protein M422DRAFT_43334 [Sphaerobolus stellatus SS14]|nr:hypothetical protein M422DRAFT_43334 [Sphaerobolus stellatus SS14]